MKKRKISKETKIKILECAAEILRMHGSIAGDRTCQDWSGDSDKNPKHIFTDGERDDLEFNHQIENSGLDDYEQGFDGFGDEMSVSFTMADAIDDIIRECS